MVFHFALEPLLRLRHSVERQRKLALQNAASQLAHARAEVVQLDEFLTGSATADDFSLVGGRSAAELHFAGELREQLRHLRLRLQQDVLRLEPLREQAASTYQQAFREREALESLRARQYRVYQVAHDRREQQRIDAVYLLQRWHHRKV
jgi:flagellar export protein FliJ